MTTDLLQRIAKCAPKEMRAKYRKGNNTNQAYIVFNNVRWRADPLDDTEWAVELVATDEPYVNSQGCEAMLDAMEKAGYVAMLDNHPSGCYRVSAWKERDPGHTCAISVNRVNTNGKTRAIAIGEAFCKVFEG